jgi:AraC-like DNA-binding protein
MTREQRFEYPAGAHLTGIRFRPGMARPFLGVAGSDLTDVSEPLDALIFSRSNELLRRLDDARSIRDAMRVLLESLRPPEYRPTPVQQAITAIAGRNGNIDLDDVARQANLSSRQFRRRCLEESGLAPKFLSRVLRFRHACRIARAFAEPDWAAVAAEAEYFDQPHFIRDFRLFTGLTPMSVFSNTRRSPSA